jgi:hypothetical protein
MIDKIINLKLMMNPINWGIVLAVLFLMSFALMNVAEAANGGKCGCND